MIAWTLLSTPSQGPCTNLGLTESRAPAEEPVSHLTAARLTRDQISGASELNDLKRQLLKESDWAAVSVTRPLELAFTSAQEIERFGKRRKLNDQDRKRLVEANTNGTTFFELPEQRRARHPSYVIDSIEDIQIEINGRPVGRSTDSSGVAINSLSSQSMLLDHEGSAVPELDLQKENQTATWITNLFPRSK